jgi:glycosyltransferase involved in cell wall biosynthesis
VSESRNINMMSIAAVSSPDDVRVLPGSQQIVDVAVVIPAFNEQDSVGPTVSRVRDALGQTPHRCQILVVDDGSTDGTAGAASGRGATVVQLPENRGYGAALKAGIAQTNAEFVAIIDADGTYPADALPKLIDLARNADMAVGARAMTDASIAYMRRPAKLFLAALASYLVGRRIPDLNSGLRVMRRSVLTEFMHLLPPGFSFTTTITLAMMCTFHRVVYLPVACQPRVGTSKLRPREFGAFIMLVLRTVVLFNPLKVFLPLGALLFMVGAFKLVLDVYAWRLSETTVLGFLSAIVVWSVGLLADMIARLQLKPR